MEVEMTPDEDSALRIYYGEVQTKLFGTTWLAATDRGICCLRFDHDAAQFISNLAMKVLGDEIPSIVHDIARNRPYADALNDYLENKVTIPSDLPVDMHQMTEFQQEILTLVRRLPFGSTTTYGEIADEIENPNASRAIGQVLRRNPIPIIIPCHRVLSADGTLGGYGGVMGSERKIELLKHEGVILA
jgi:methylated-DNA-[protein]-cysteine S-methyltransferase